MKSSKQQENCTVKSIYIYFACVFVCLFVRPIFCWTSSDPREGLWMIEFSKNLLLPKFDF